MCALDDSKDILQSQITTENGCFIALNSNVIARTSIKVEIDNTMLNISPLNMFDRIDSQKFQLTINRNR